MPVSSKPPDEGDRSKGSSTGSSDGNRKKRKSKPTSKARSRKQKIKDRYAHAREDAQLAGLIPTTKEESLTPEAVPPSAQAAVSQPELIAQAIRRGWAVPEDRKAGLVDELIGLLDNPEASHKVKVAAFNALRMADQQQHERDHPELAVARAKTGGVATAIVSVSVESNRAAVTTLREMFENGNEFGGGDTGLPPPHVPGPPGSGRFDGEVETGAASTED